MKGTPPVDLRTGSKAPHRGSRAVPPQSEVVDDFIAGMAEAYGAELARRRLQVSSPEVYEVSGEGGPLIPPGTLLLATGAADDEFFADLATAARAGDVVGVSDVISRIRQATAEAERPGSGRVASEVLEDIETFGQVSYAGELIAHAQMISSSIRVSLALLPFNGGTLPASSFSASHFHNTEDARAETLVLVRQPVSTDLEARVSREFAAVSADELLGPMRPEANWLVATAFVLVVGAGVAGAYYLAHRAQEAVHADHAANEEAAGGLPVTLPSERADLLDTLAPLEASVGDIDTHAPLEALISLRAELLKSKQLG